jgi:hypothetical protein
MALGCRWSATVTALRRRHGVYGTSLRPTPAKDRGAIKAEDAFDVRSRLPGILTETVRSYLCRPGMRSSRPR